MKINDEPVYYCKACISLHILDNNGDDLCGNCGAVNFVSVVPFEEYLKIKDEDSSKIES